MKTLDPASNGNKEQLEEINGTLLVLLAVMITIACSTCQQGRNSDRIADALERAYPAPAKTATTDKD